jgi:hypothetical protein
MMSMPCTYPHHDWLMYILYSCDATFLHQIIRSAMRNICASHGTAGIKEAAEIYEPSDEDCLHTLRIKLLVLLDQDEETRRKLTEYKSNVARDWHPVCPRKATRFYAELHDQLLPDWIKDETITNSEFVDRARMAYLVS